MRVNNTEDKTLLQNYVAARQEQKQILHTPHNPVYAVVKRSIPVRGQTPHHKITLHNTNFCHIAILILDIIQIF
mgnify:CR=1 FL=1